MSIIKLSTDNRYTATYKVTGITTETDEEIIEYCDPNSFGGRVLRVNNEAIVTVYID